MERRDVITGFLGAFVGAGAMYSDVVVANSSGSVSFAKLRKEERDESLEQFRPVLDFLAEARQARQFRELEVQTETVKKIVDFGLSALSHRNAQPWFISVVSDAELLKAIDAKSDLDSSKRLSFGGAPVAVIVSATPDDTDYQHYAIGCLVERMTIAAYTLGLGCKTVIAGLKGANEEPLRGKLRIPEGYDAYVALLLGYEETPSVDGVSGATSREADPEKVAYI